MKKSDFSLGAARLIHQAILLALEHGHRAMGAEYLLLILVRDHEGALQEALLKSTVDFKVLHELFLQHLPARPGTVLTRQQVLRTDIFKRVIAATPAVRHELQHEHIEVEHIAIALLRQNSSLTRDLLVAFGITDVAPIIKAIEPELTARLETEALEALFRASPSTQ